MKFFYRFRFGRTLAGGCTAAKQPYPAGLEFRRTESPLIKRKANAGRIMPQAVLERQGYEASCSYLRPAHLSGTLYLRHTHRSALRKSPTCCHNRGTRQEKVKTSLTAVLGCTTIAALLSAASLEAAEITASVQPHQAHYREAFLLAGNEDFWQNLTQYARFFVSVLVRAVLLLLDSFVEQANEKLCSASVSAH